MLTLSIVVSVATTIVSYFLFARVAGSMSPTRPTMISFIFYFPLLAASYLGSIIILNYDGYINEVLVRSQSREVRLMVWLSVSYVMIALPAGMLMAKRLIGVKSARRLFNKYCRRPLVPLQSRRDSALRMILYALTLLCLGVTGYTYHVLGLDTFRVVMTADNPVDLLILRTRISADFPGNVYVKNIIGMSLTPILSYVALAYFVMTRRRSDLMWFILLLACTLLMLFHNLTKSGIPFYLLGFAPLYVVVKGPLRIRTLGLIGAVSGLTLFGLYAFLVRNVDPAYHLSPLRQGLVGRVVVSQVSSLYRHFDIFPEEHDHIGGRSLSRPLSRLTGTGHVPRSGRIVLERTRATWIEQGYGGVLNTIFIGEAWANFGWMGLLLSPLWVGFVIGILFLTLLRLPKTPLLVGVLAYLSVRSSVGAGINDYLYHPVLWVTLMILIGAVWAAQVLRASTLSEGRVDTMPA